MPKKGVSVTLAESNLLWLKSRTRALKGRSLSETLDDLVTAARTGGSAPAAPSQSVVGTVDIATDDPSLDLADEYMRDLVTASINRPFVARERPEPGPLPRSRRRG